MNTSSNLVAFVTYHPDLAYFVKFVLRVVPYQGWMAVGIGPPLSRVSYTWLPEVDGEVACRYIEVSFRRCESSLRSARRM